MARTRARTHRRPGRGRPAGAPGHRGRRRRGAGRGGMVAGAEPGRRGGGPAAAGGQHSHDDGPPGDGPPGDRPVLLGGGDDRGRRGRVGAGGPGGRLRRASGRLPVGRRSPCGGSGGRCGRAVARSRPRRRRPGRQARGRPARLRAGVGRGPRRISGGRVGGDSGGASGSSGGGTGGATGPTPDAPLDLNVATAAQLDQLPGVGPATAAAIIAYRDKHGPFQAVEGLLDVRGIGTAKLDAIRDLVRV